MQKEVITAGPETTVAKAAATMRKMRVGCLPILDHGKLVGVVSTREMLDVLAKGPAH
jgi:acetoin utilization protein AcuB